MQKTKSDLVARVRINVGSPSESTLGSAQVGSAIDSAVYEYSRFKGKTVFATFSTENGSAEKAMSDIIPGSAVLDVQDCFWDPIGMTFDEDLYRTVPELGYQTLAGINVFENPSVVSLYRQKLEAFKANFGGDWEYYDETLRLMPAPTQDGSTVGVIATCVKPLAEIPDMDEDNLLLWAEAQCHRIVAEKQSKLQSASMEGASISYNVQAQMDSAESKEERFRKRLGGGVGSFVAG